MLGLSFCKTDTKGTIEVPKFAGNGQKNARRVLG
jgi:hypothetical protein